jgi:hypothetical protein
MKYNVVCPATVETGPDGEITFPIVFNPVVETPEPSPDEPPPDPPDPDPPPTDPPPDPPPDPDPDPTPINKSELLIFDWNGNTRAGKVQITECTALGHEYICERGCHPVRAAFDWTKPINFAQGTLYIRYEIKSACASHKTLKLIFNNWQYVVPGIVNNSGEEYLPNSHQKPIRIAPGVKGQFSLPVASLTPYKAAGPIDWSKPITRRGWCLRPRQGLRMSNQRLSISGIPWLWWPRGQSSLAGKIIDG